MERLGLGLLAVQGCWIELLSLSPLPYPTAYLLSVALACAYMDPEDTVKRGQQAARMHMLIFDEEGMVWEQEVNILWALFFSPGHLRPLPPSPGAATLWIDN